MSVKKLLVLLGTLVLAGALLVACAGEQGPQGEPGPPILRTAEIEGQIGEHQACR